MILKRRRAFAGGGESDANWRRVGAKAAASSADGTALFAANDNSENKPGRNRCAWRKSCAGPSLSMPEHVCTGVRQGRVPHAYLSEGLGSWCKSMSMNRRAARAHDPPSPSLRNVCHAMVWVGTPSAC